MKQLRLRATVGAVLAGNLLACMFVPAAMASSHREAPFITKHPKIDATDFYMFRSYQAGRSEYTTLIANYVPLQDAYGGPNFFMMDPEALYEIHIDNNGDGVEDLTFQFRFTDKRQGLAVKTGDKSIPVPLTNIGPVTTTDMSAQNVVESYTLTLMRGDRRHGHAQPIVDASNGSATFPSRWTTSALNPSPTTPTMPTVSFTPSRFPGATHPARCSWVSAWTGSSSILGKPLIS